jgi:hypothetical protein
MVLYSSESKFYGSTSRSATIAALDDAGFKNIAEMKFDPLQGDDANGILNREYANFCNGLADQACLKNSEEAGRSIPCHIHVYTWGARYDSNLELKQELWAASWMQ